MALCQKLLLLMLSALYCSWKDRILEKEEGRGKLKLATKKKGWIQKCKHSCPSSEIWGQTSMFSSQDTKCCMPICSADTHCAHTHTHTQCSVCWTVGAELSISSPALTAYPGPQRLGQGGWGWGAGWGLTSTFNRKKGVGVCGGGIEKQRCYYRPFTEKRRIAS